MDFEIGKIYVFGIKGIEGYFESKVIDVNEHGVKLDRHFSYPSSSWFGEYGNGSSWFKKGDLYDVCEVVQKHEENSEGEG